MEGDAEEKRRGEGKKRRKMGRVWKGIMKDGRCRGGK